MVRAHLFPPLGRYLRVFGLILTILCFPFFSNGAAFAVRYLISTYDVALARGPDPRSDSPRVYLSTNPWKVTSSFQTISSTREDYIALIEKVEFAHQNLIATLEGRLEAVDKEITVRILTECCDPLLSPVILLPQCLCGLHLFSAVTAGTQKG
jgi:hypothetical protein